MITFSKHARGYLSKRVSNYAEEEEVVEDIKKFSKGLKSQKRPRRIHGTHAQYLIAISGKGIYVITIYKLQRHTVKKKFKKSPFGHSKKRDKKYTHNPKTRDKPPLHKL